MPDTKDTEATRELDEAELRAAIAADAPRRKPESKSVTSALREVALIHATEGGRAAVAWRDLANVLGAQLGLEAVGAVPPPELAPPLRELAGGGNPALAQPHTGVARRAQNVPVVLPPPAAATGGRVTQTGPRTKR
jgi:hypothetical protein